MNFDNQPTIRALPSVNVGEVSEGTTPAIAAFMKAFQQGTIDADAIQSAFRSGVENVSKLSATQKQVQQDKLDKQIAPLIAKRKALEEQSAIDINPSKTAATIGANEVAAGKLEIAKRQLPGESAIADAVTRVGVDSTKQAQQVMDKDPSGASLSAMQWHEKNIGPVPTFADGEVDVDSMRQTVDEVVKYNSSLKEQGVNAAAKAATIKSAVEKGVSLYNPNGTPRPIQDVEAEALKAPPILTQKEVDAHVASARSSDASLEGIQLARSYVNDVKTTPVGPGASEGSTVNQWWNATKAFFGNEAGVEKARQQNELEQQLSQGVLTAIKALAGSGAGRIMQSEVRLMERGQPHISSNKLTWNRWLDKAEKMITNARKDAIAPLPPAVAQNLPAPPASGVPQPSNTTAKLPGIPANAEAISKAENRTLVRTQAEFDKLGAGHPFVDSYGVRGMK